MNQEFDFEKLRSIPVDLATNITPGEEKKVEPQTTSDSEFFNHTTADQQQPQQQPPFENKSEYFSQPMQAGTKLNFGELFPAKLMVDLTDNVLSKVIAAAAGKIAKVEINSKALQATATEKNTLEPVVKNYLNSINFTLTPFNALLLTLATIYGSKAIEVVNYAKATGQGQERATNTVRVVKNQARNTGETRGRKPKDTNSRYMQKKRQQQQ